MKWALLFSSTLLFFGSCRFAGKRVNGNGKVTTENRSASRASKIRLTGSMDVVIDSGASAIKVEADENLLPYIVTEVNGDWLTISFRRNVNINTSNNIRVFVTTPSVSNLQVTGSGNVTSSKKFFSPQDMRFDITGSGDVVMDINTPKIDADITGSGNLKLSGETRDIKVDIAGSGNFKARDLKAENVTVNVMGSGDADVFADAHLDAKVMGSGNVRYKGNAEVKKSTMGSGTVQQVQ